MELQMELAPEIQTVFISDTIGWCFPVCSGQAIGLCGPEIKNQLRKLTPRTGLNEWEEMIDRRYT